MSELHGFLDAVLNLSRYHREHEKFYARAPLRSALALHDASLTVKTMADRWRTAQATDAPGKNPYMGCDDLNEPVAIQQSGVLFMEGEGEPPEVARLKRELGTLAGDLGETGRWLETAMASSWQAALPLLRVPALAGVLGERHRIITNNWQAAQRSGLAATILLRSLAILDRVDFSPPAVRADLAGPRAYPDYLYAAAELIDRAADIVSDSVSLTHDNDRRWRVFRERVLHVTGLDLERAAGQDGTRHGGDGGAGEVGRQREPVAMP